MTADGAAPKDDQEDPSTEQLWEELLIENDRRMQVFIDAHADDPFFKE